MRDRDGRASKGNLCKYCQDYGALKDYWMEYTSRIEGRYDERQVKHWLIIASSPDICILFKSFISEWKKIK